jgi:hypothetical protein
MNKASRYDVQLVLDWNDLGASASLRRNTAGFATIKSLAAQTNSGRPLVINAFLYAFLCPAKNFDLFLKENIDAISGTIVRIEQKMNLLTEFERRGLGLREPGLRNTYLAARNIVARKNARDEQRTLATLLFSGPSAVNQIAQDLGVSENLAERILRVLDPVTEEPAPGRFRLRADTDTLAVVLQLLRSTLGLDPIRVLMRRIEARKSEAAP